jgi:hypothetical protein
MQYFTCKKYCVKIRADANRFAESLVKLSLFGHFYGLFYNIHDKKGGSNVKVFVKSMTDFDFSVLLPPENKNAGKKFDR